MGRNKKDNRDLRLEVWKESIKRIPKTRKVRGKSSQIFEKDNPDGGKVDLYSYGGKKSKSQKLRDLMTGAKYRKKDKDKEKTRKEWKKVAKEVGVNLNSESDVAQMIDHVMGMGRQKEKPEETVNPPSKAPEPEKFIPTEGHQDARDDYEESRDNPVPRMSDQPGMADNTSNPYLDAITHGDDLNDWYTEFVKAEKDEARLAAYEIGERTRFHVGRFDGKVPELADTGKLYQDYAKKIS